MKRILFLLLVFLLPVLGQDTGKHLTPDELQKRLAKARNVLQNDQAVKDMYKKLLSSEDLNAALLQNDKLSGIITSVSVQVTQGKPATDQVLASTQHLDQEVTCLLRETYDFVYTSESTTAAFLKRKLEAAEVEVYLKPGTDLLKQRKYTQAQQVFQTLAENALSTVRGHEASGKVMTCILAQPGDITDKIERYKTWLRGLPVDDHGYGLLNIAEAYIQAERPESAKAEVNTILDHNYAPEIIVRAKYLSAALKISDFDFTDARAILQGISGSEAAAEIQDRIVYCLAWCMIVSGDNEQGIQLLQDFKTQYPDSEYTRKIDNLLETAHK